MNILYKYYSSTFDIVEHLKSPSMKLSHVASFNDPFESKLPTMQAEAMANNLMAKIKENNNEIKSNHMESYKNINSAFGVVSLSETHRNLLMWAHYASSHKGICVGYKSDFFERLKKLPYHFDGLKTIYTPQRVTYDSLRFDPERLNDSPELIYLALRKKSDEWIYEKEHRCIIPFLWSDKVRISSNANTTLKEAINKLIIEGGLSKTEEKNTYVINESPDKYVNVIAMSALYDYISMLKNININSIDSIYLGSLYGDSEKELIVNAMNSSPDKYGHISLYKYEVDKNEFKLNISPLLNSKI